MIRVDSIFFDVDGTLVDSTADITNAMNRALKLLGLIEKPKDEIVSYIGTGVRDLAKKSAGSEDSRLVDEVVKIFSDYYVAHSIDNSTLYPHVKDVLEYFRDKNKYILTNRYKKFAETTLKGLGIRGYFKDILGGDDENCLKPSACVINGFLPENNIDKAKALIVGDMDIDIMTGKNSGIKTCWVSYGLGKVDDVSELNPDYIIDDLIELTRIIK